MEAARAIALMANTAPWNTHDAHHQKVLIAMAMKESDAEAKRRVEERMRRIEALAMRRVEERMRRVVDTATLMAVVIIHRAPLITEPQNRAAKPAIVAPMRRVSTKERAATSTDRESYQVGVATEGDSGRMAGVAAAPHLEPAEATERG